MDKRGSDCNHAQEWCDREAEGQIRDQSLWKFRKDEAIAMRRVEPNSQHRKPASDLCDGIHDDTEFFISIGGMHASRKRKKGNTEQKDEVQDHERSIGVREDMEHLIVLNSVHADQKKTEEIADDWKRGCT